MMNREEGLEGELSKQRMENFLREIMNFKKDAGENIRFDSYTGRVRKALVEVEEASDACGHGFMKGATSSKWIEKGLEVSLAEGSIGDAVRFMIEYLLEYHGKKAREAL